MPCFNVRETIDHILYLQNLWIFVLLFCLQNSYCVFCWSSLFDDWFEFSTLFGNARIVLFNICFVSTWMKQSIIFGRCRFSLCVILYISSKNCYIVFFSVITFDIHVKFVLVREMDNGFRGRFFLLILIKRLIEFRNYGSCFRFSSSFPSEKLSCF
jgi:hypothetical protein